MFLVLEVEAVEDSFLFYLSNIAVVVLALKPSFPGLHLGLFDLHELDETLIFINEVGILCEEDLDFLLEFIHPIKSVVEDGNLLIQGLNFSFKVPASDPPVLLS